MPKQIRLWTLGDFEHKIIPNKETIDNFKKELESAKANAGADGHLDIVWTPDLKLQVFEVPDTEIKVTGWGFGEGKPAQALPIDYIYGT